MDINFISVPMSYSRVVVCYTGEWEFAMNRLLTTDGINKKWTINNG
jgi:hypothetical protein